MTVAVMRFSALGDVANAIPALEALPAPPLVVTSPLGRPLLEPLASDVVVLPGKRLRDVARLVAALRRRRPELLVDLQRNDRTRLVRALAGARAVTLPPIDLATNERCAARLFLDLVERHVPGAAYDARFVPRPRDYVVIHAGASPRWPSKRVPAAQWARIGDLLRERLGVPLVLTGTAEERPYVESIAAVLPDPVDVVAGDTSLEALRELLAGACLMVSTDSGPMHLAAVLRTPTIGLFGATNWRLSAPFGPWSVAVHDEVWYRDRPIPVRTEMVPEAAYAHLDVAGALDRLAPYLSPDGTGVAAPAAQRP